MEIFCTKMQKLRNRAFTLLELLVSITIIAILAAFLIPAVRSVYASSTDAVSAHVISQLNAAAQSYLAENNQTYWPYRMSDTGELSGGLGMNPKQA